MTATACKKEGADSGGGAAGDELALLPSDVDAVIGLNFAQMQQSAIWKQTFEPMVKKMQAKESAKYEAIKGKCGLDPMGDVKSAVIGIKAVGDKPDVVAVVHGIDKTKALACVDKVKDDLAAQGAEATRDGDVLLIKDKRGDMVGVTFVNDTTALVVAGDKVDAAKVKALAKGGTPSALLADRDKVKTADSIWFIAGGQAVDAMPVSPKPKAAYGSLNLADGISVDAKLRYESPQVATQQASTFADQAKQVQQMAPADTMDFKADGDTVKITVAYSSEKLKPVLGLLQMAAGSMMMR